MSIYLNRINIIKENLLNLLPSRFYVCDEFKDEQNNKIENPNIYKIQKEEFNENIREFSLNNSYYFVGLVIDVDEKYNKEKIDKLVKNLIIPEPTWITINKRTNKFHVVYLFNKKYSKSLKFAYKKNVKNYKLIVEHFSKVLKGDLAYKGLWTHNPFYNGFNIDYLTANIYEINDLLFFCNNNKKEKIENKYKVSNNHKELSLSTGKDFRNNTIFLRTMSNFNHGYSYDEALKSALNDMKTYNKNLTKSKKPMLESEIRNIVKSANKYHSNNKNHVYYDIDLDGKVKKKSNRNYLLFIEKQKERSKKGLAVRRDNASKAIEEMIILIENGYSKKEIMRKLNICKSTYYNYLKVIKNILDKTLKDFKKQEKVDKDLLDNNDENKKEKVKTNIDNDMGDNPSKDSNESKDSSKCKDDEDKSESEDLNNYNENKKIKNKTKMITHIILNKIRTKISFNYWLSYFKEMFNLENILDLNEKILELQF